jgi:hypothetical protein
MARTPIIPTTGVYSGSAVPSATPDSNDAIYYQISPTGTILGMYFWDASNAVWVLKAEAVTSANWTSITEFGWVGKHNDARHQASPAYTTLADAGTLLPFFGVDEPSTSALEFKIFDKLTGDIIATGTFPANSRRATAEQCNLVDDTNTPVSAFTVPSGVAVQLAAAPLNGYAAAPSTGYGFSAEGRFVYA